MAGGRGLWAAAAVAFVAVSGCREGGGIHSAIPGFKATPSALDFGPTALHTPNQLELVIANEGKASYTVREVRPTAPNVWVEVEVPFELSAGQRRAIKVKFVPEVEGQIAGMVEVITDAPEAGDRGVAQLGVRGQGVRAVAQLSADELDFGNVELNTVVLMPLVISNPTEAATQVRVTFEGPDQDEYSAADTENQWSLAAGERRTVDVAFNPTRLGATEATAFVQVCTACEPKAVPLRGVGVASQLEISPMTVDFGAVSLGAEAEQIITVRNLGTTDLDYSGASFLNDAGGVFHVVRAPALANDKLTAGSSVSITVGFRPASVALSRGMLQLRAGVAGAPAPKLNVLGSGGAACVTTSPRSLDFGDVPQGMTATRTVEVLNRCRRAVDLSQFSVSAQSGGFFSLANGVSFVNIPAGGASRVAVSFTPKAGSTTSAGALKFEVQDGGSRTTEEISLGGALGTFGPCSYQLAPASLDFRRVAVGSSVTRTVTLTNTGAERCFLASLQLAPGSDLAFSAETLPSRVLEAGESVQLRIAFQPPAGGPFAAMAEAYLNAASGHPMIPISGEGVESCLSFQPPTIDFGVARVSCGPQGRPLVAYNRCPTDLVVEALQLSDASSNEFSLSGTTANVTVRAGTNAQWELGFRPTDDGAESAGLIAKVAGQGEFTVGLLGEGSTRDTRTDRFKQETEAKVDVLFVIDNSGSMMEEQQNLGRNFAAFMTAAQAQNIDYQIGVTTTGLDASPGGWSRCPGGVDGGENGRLFPADGSSPRIITRETPNAAEVFAHNVQVGWCHWNEQGLDGAQRALSQPLIYAADDTRTSQLNDGNLGFLRADAKLAIVFVTDEEDFSTQTVSYYETFFRALKNNDPGLLTVSAIAGPEDLASCPSASSTGSRYRSLARATGGVVESICTPDWASSLKKLSDNAFGARRAFRLAETPSDFSRIEVRVDGIQVTSGWSFDASSQSIHFEELAVPAPGAEIEITYPTAC